jgi:phospholipase C
MIICLEKLLRAALTSGATVALSFGTLLATTSASVADDDRADLKSIKHIIVIYQENWSFDSLYGQFPGADGYANSFDTLPQVDVKAAPAYASLIYRTPSPLNNSAIDPQFPSFGGNLTLNSNHTLALPLIPYDFTTYIPADGFTGDIVQRFYHEQLQIGSAARAWVRDVDF